MRRYLSAPTRLRYRWGRSSSGRPLRRRAAGYNRPTGPAPQTARCGAFPVLVERNDDCTGTLKSASSGFSTPTATSRSSRPDLLCLVAGLGVVAVEERALLGSCDRRTAVGRRDYAVIITLLWLGAAGREAAGHHRRERAHRRQRHKNNDRFDSKRAMMPRSVSHDRQRSAAILSRRSSPNSTSCPDPTSAAIRKHLPPAPLVNCGPSGTRAVTRPLDRTGAVRHHWSQTDHHIVCRCHTVSGGQVVSPAHACGRAQRAALAIGTSSSNSLGSVDNRLHR